MGSRLSLADAVARVTFKSDASVSPVVSASEVSEILLSSRTPDSDGNLPGDTEWEETFDINKAVASVFEVKASRVSGKFDLNVDGQDLSRSQQYQHYVAQAAAWRQKQAFTWPR